MAQPPNALQIPGPLGQEDNPLVLNAPAGGAAWLTGADAVARQRASDIANGLVDPATGALTPAGRAAQIQAVMGGFGPADIGMLGTIKPRIPFYQKPANVHEAKYIMPDGTLFGAGDNTHEYLAHSMGYGTGDAGVKAMQEGTGAVRLNIANALFGEGGDVSILGTLTDAQMRQLAKYVNQRDITGVGHNDNYGSVRNGAELRRMIMGTDD